MINSVKSFGKVKEYNIYTGILMKRKLLAILSIRVIKFVSASHDLPKRKPCCSELIKFCVLFNNSFCIASSMILAVRQVREIDRGLLISHLFYERALC